MRKPKNEVRWALKIYFEDSANIRLISAMSTLYKREEREYLQHLIEGAGDRKVDIFIYEADVLHGCALKMLCDYVDTRKIKVHVQKKHLHSYLLRCGIPSSLIKMVVSHINDSMTAEPELTDEFLNSFTGMIHSRYGFDFREYQKSSLKRRLLVFMKKEGIWNFKRVYEKIMENRVYFENLMIDFPIRTTEFFRDSGVFNIIRNKLLPYLNSYPSIKIWCSGCSTGEEPYSLAILLDEAGMLDKTRIYATDLNPNVVEEARNAMFGIEAIKKGAENYIDAGGQNNFYDCFTFNGKCGKIKKRFRSRILFFQHSLTNTGILNEFQLILCRNVLMYFNNSLQDKVLKLFYDSMDLSAFLLLGKSEGIYNDAGHELFFAYDRDHRIYRKKELLAGEERW